MCAFQNFCQILRTDFFFFTFGIDKSSKRERVVEQLVHTLDKIIGKKISFFKKMIISSHEINSIIMQEIKFYKEELLA